MFLDIPQEKMKTESYGEICQRKFYYAFKMKQMASYALKSKARVYEIPFTFKIEIDTEKLKGLPENEQQFYSDVCDGKFYPTYSKSAKREKEIERLASNHIDEAHF